MLEAFVSRMVFPDGADVTFEPASFVLLVGPNNVGKSATLKSLDAGRAGRGVSSGFLSERWFSLAGSGADLQTLAERYGIVLRGDEPMVQVMGLTMRLQHMTLGTMISNVLNYDGLLMGYLPTESRISGSNAANAVDFGRQVPMLPLHFLHQDADLRRALGRWFHALFGTEIGVDVSAGTVIPLHVGEGAEPRAGEGEIDRPYRTRLRTLPRLEEQGDGMRSCATILLHLLAMPHRILLIDEPEAFLHPPQARAMGMLLGNEAGVRQVVAATHSADFLRGLLQSAHRNVQIIRLTRVGGKAAARRLTQDEVAATFADPVLRSTNVLDGIFHERVVVCEADGDCRFYEAVADAMRVPRDHPFLRDVLFVRAGGKGGIPKIVAALRRLGIDVRVIVDFDVLRQVGQLRAILDALGGDMETLRADLIAVRGSIEEMGNRSVESVKRDLLKLVEAIPDDAAGIPLGLDARVRSALKDAPGWRRAKSAGLGMLDGAARSAGRRLLTALSRWGLLVVPGGELEGFDAELAVKKDEWVNGALEKFADRLGTASELEDARTLVAAAIGDAAEWATVGGG